MNKQSEIIRELQSALEDGSEDIYIYWARKCRLHVTKEMVEELISAPTVNVEAVEEITGERP